MQELSLWTITIITNNNNLRNANNIWRFVQHLIRINPYLFISQFS